MTNPFLLLGALSAGISVAAGAFGAHALREKVEPRLLEVFQTGAQQMASVLTQLQQRQNSSPRDAIAAFFPATTGRFLESLVRPDTFNIDNTFISPAQFSQMTR